jgi:PAS domain S-box-containing protein
LVSVAGSGGKAVFDVVKRKKSIAQMRFQVDLLNAVEQAIVATDKDGIVTYWNRAAERLHCWSEKEMKGQSISKIFPEEVAQDQMARTHSCLEIGKPWTGETLVKRRDGTDFPIKVTVSPLLDGEGKFAGSVTVETDISEEKWMQKALIDTIQKVQELNEKIRGVESLTRHDVRNKLAALNGRVYLLRKKVEGNNGALQQVKEIELVADQILRILEFERLYIEVGAEESKTVDVETCVNEAAGLFSDLKQAKLVNECHGLTVLADSMLRQVFYNLIDDTLKYGKNVSVIRIYFEEEKDQLKIIYEDNGVGIPDEARSKLFTEGYGKGTGYGLYLIKRICEGYGWTIQEMGVQGKGAKFTMAIPKGEVDGKKRY